MYGLLYNISFALTLTMLIIGIYESIVYSIQDSYFFFAFSLGFLFLMKLFKDRIPKDQEKKKPEKDTIKTKNENREPRRSRRMKERQKKKNN